MVCSFPTVLRSGGKNMADRILYVSRIANIWVSFGNPVQCRTKESLQLLKSHNCFRIGPNDIIFFLRS